MLRAAQQHSGTPHAASELPARDAAMERGSLSTFAMVVSAHLGPAHFPGRCHSTEPP